MDIRDIKEQLKTQLKGNDNLAGIGLTRIDGVLSIKVNLKEKKEDNIPRELHGVKIITEVIGQVQAK